MLFNKISQNEQNMISQWIKNYSCSCGKEKVPEIIPLQHILRFWETNKSEYLYRLLNNQLILEKEVCYSCPQENIERDISLELDCGKMCSFKEKVLSQFETYNNMWYNAKNLFRTTYLFNNKYDFGRRDYKFIIKNEEVIIKSGSKPMKALRKIAKIIGAEAEFEKFRIAHSMALNQKQVKGTLCLSIHPFDFMTMSDNSYHWDSCMSWVHNGCFRAGTVEMMNSAYVLVAYLKGNQPYQCGNYSWLGNKKWRQLMIVHPHAICNIKAYPYHNDDLTMTALNWIVELAKNNLNWDIPYKETDLTCENHIVYHDDRTYLYNFTTDIMYNDFDAEDTHHHIFIPQGWQDFPVNKKYYDEINISGPLTCVWCGDQIYEVEEGCEDQIVCDNCNPTIRCAGCGCRIEEEGQNWAFNDNCYCDYCYDDLFTINHLTGDQIYFDDSVNVYLARKENQIDSYNDSHIRVSDESLNEGKLMEYQNYFNIPSIRVGKNEWRRFYYVYAEDCTKEGLKLFGIEDEIDLESYLKVDFRYYEPVNINPI